MYDIKEEGSEGESGEDDDDIGENSEEESKVSSSQAVAVPQPSILQRTLDSMNHAEAQQETADALMIMYDTMREQTDRLAELFRLEESKAPSLVQSSTKRSTFNPSDSRSIYSGTRSMASSSIMTT